MTENEITLGNKLIAEFGELDYLDNFNYPEQNEEGWYNNKGIFLGKDLIFHSSWDWLMPVIEEIESLMYFFNSAPFIDDETNKLSGEYFCVILEKTTNLNLPYFIDITGCSTKIEANYKAVVEFIKWYNINKK